MANGKIQIANILKAVNLRAKWTKVGGRVVSETWALLTLDTSMPVINGILKQFCALLSFPKTLFSKCYSFYIYDSFNPYF